MRDISDQVIGRVWPYGCRQLVPWEQGQKTVKPGGAAAQ